MNSITQNGVNYSKRGSNYSKRGSNYSKRGPITQNGGPITQNRGGDLNCSKCGKLFSRQFNKQRHEEVCNGNKLQCSICLKRFSTPHCRAKHERTISCKPPVAINNITYNIINNYNITNNDNSIKQITYNEQKRCLESNDPTAPAPALLCLDGFRIDSYKNSLNVDQSQLQIILDKLKKLQNKDYDSLWRFFFRNIDNKQMQMCMLQKNNNATHASIFNKGTLETMNKNMLYQTISSCISSYIIHIDMDYIDIVQAIKDESECKRSFFHIIKDESDIFDYYKKWL